MTVTRGGQARALTLVLVAFGTGCTLSAEGESSSTAGSSSSATSSGASSTGAGGGTSSGEGGAGAASSSSSSAASTGGAGAAGGEKGSGGQASDECVAPDVFDAASGRCYRFFTQATLYEDVQAECEKWHPNGRFAAMSTKAEYDFLAVAFASETDFWIGGDDLDDDGSWQWQNGEPWGEASGWGQEGSEPWKTDEPMGGDGERCLRVKAWLFESKNCDAQPFLCERP